MPENEQLGAPWSQGFNYEDNNGDRVTVYHIIGDHNGCRCTVWKDGRAVLLSSL